MTLRYGVDGSRRFGGTYFILRGQSNPFSYRQVARPAVELHLALAHADAVKSVRKCVYEYSEIDSETCCIL